MKYFVFGDVHGFYNELIAELQAQGFDESNQNHMLISLGDNFDRGSQNYEMFEFLKKMKTLKKIILVKGNHEDLIETLIDRRVIYSHDITNGTYKTILQFINKYFGNTEDSIINIEVFYDMYNLLYTKLKTDGFFELLNGMIDYYETPHYIFTHGYIPCINSETYTYNPEWRQTNKKEFARARWYNGMELAEYHKIYEPNKIIVFGHFYSAYGNVRKAYGFETSPKELEKLEFTNPDFSNPYVGEHIICLDACTVYTKKVNVLVVDD